MQPLLAEWEKSYGFKLVIISPDSRSEMQKFIEKNHITATTLLDPHRKVIKQYGVQSIPADFLIGRNGQLEESFVGWGSQSVVKMEKWLKS